MSWLNLTRGQMAPSTTARRLTSIRSYAKWAGWGRVLDEYIAPTPGKSLPHPIAEGPDGVRRMIQHAKNCQQAALVALGGFVGLRISESLSVTTRSFDLDSMLLEVRGKGDKTRTVPVSEEAWSNIVSAFALAMPREDYHLITYKDRFSRQIVKNLGVKAKLSRPVSSHDLRATFATAVYDKTQDLRVVQELLGHSSSQTTEVYTGIGMAKMKDAVEL